MITGGQSGISRQAKRWEEKQIEGIRDKINYYLYIH